MENLVILPFLLVFLPYLLLVVSLFAGWLRIRPFRPGCRPPVTSVSILVPCRNEEENIKKLAVALEGQDYPGELLEVIWINDHSDDGTGEQLGRLVERPFRHKVVTLTEKATGKKSALKAGMQQASGDLILLTDADSRPRPLWVRTLAAFHEETGADLVIGPVAVDPHGKQAGRIQQLEFLSLAAAATGSSGLGKPFMAHGPNIAVRASDYRKIVHDLNDRYASGDDMFLLQAMRNLKNKKIRFIRNRDAIVTTPAAGTLKEFIRQRIRWASKTGGYSHLHLVIPTWLVFLANASISLSLLFGFLGWMPLTVFAILAGLKFLSDLPLLLSAMRFYQCPGILPWLLPAQLAYPFYVTLTGILSRFATIRWKSAAQVD